MKCPHCLVAFSAEWDETDAFGEVGGEGIEIHNTVCPECKSLTVKLVFGPVASRQTTPEYSRLVVDRVTSESIIYPTNYVRPIEPEVPDEYRKDFLEACGVLNISPKASAALSRRILQRVLREEFFIKERSLAQEIDEFIQIPDLPTHLAEAVGAVRSIGDFAAHPLKNTHAGAIVEVEVGEGEWLIDLLDALFDYTFVQPKRLVKRKRQFGRKLQELAKSEMKGGT